MKNETLIDLEDARSGLSIAKRELIALQDEERLLHVQIARLQERVLTMPAKLSTAEAQVDNYETVITGLEAKIERDVDAKARAAVNKKLAAIADLEHQIAVLKGLA